ncbi:MAG TPA: twin-arginine translocase subunit TatC [Thermoleophilia bacterium]
MSSNRERSMSLVGHLGELRKRITWAAVAIVICCIGAFIEKKYVFAVLMQPLKHTPYAGQKLLAFTATEPFMAILKISIYAGLIISLPIILWQFWAFIMPALYENERKNIFPYVALTTGLFLGGVVFGYYVVLPIGLKWLLQFSAGQFTVMLHVDAYVSFVSLFLLAFGVVFELPLVMMLLAWSGIVDYKKMAKVRKWAILVEAVVAMVITPSQDPISMMLMLIPLMILYEFGIWLSRIVSKRKARRRELAVLAEAGIPENTTPATLV